MLTLYKLMLIVLTGKTASGKDTLIARLLQKYPDFKKVLTSTTRPQREGEVNGVDYNFLSEQNFRQKIDHGDFLEYVEYGGNFYGTEKSRINAEDSSIWKIEPSMAGKAKQLFPNSIVIYITTADEVILRRLRERGLSDQEIEKRMQDDQKFWDLYKDQYDFVVENPQGKLDETVRKISQIIENHIH